MLIADDEPLVTTYLRCLLEELDPTLEIVVAQNGKDLIGLARTIRLDAAFVDVRMPIVNGIEAMTILKKESLCPPWFVLSSYPEFSYARSALRLSALGYILKPPSKEEIGAALQKLTDERNVELERRTEKFRTMWTILAMENRDGALPLTAGALIRSVLVVVDGLVPWQSRPEAFRRLELLFLERLRVYIEQDVLAAATAPHDNELRAGRVSAIEAVVAVESVYKSAPNPSVLAAYITDVAAAVVASPDGQNPRVIVASTAPVLSINGGRQGIVRLRRLLKYRALISEGKWEEKEIERHLSSSTSGDLEAAEMCALLVEALDAGDSSTILYRAVRACNSLVTTTVRGRTACLSFLRRTAGPEVETAIATGDSAAFSARGNIWSGRYPSTEKRQEDTRIVAIGEYVHSCIRNPGAAPISLAATAAALGYTPNYFSSLFRKLTGTTFGAFITNLRLERSRELLAEGRSVKEVARAIGYGNERYYAQVFNERFGETPSTFKQRAVKNKRSEAT